MNLRYFHVDAFTDRPFAGNPAAVVPLDAWLPDATMQAIAAELNLSETAFFAPEHAASTTAAPADFRLRWFTPAVEVDLCGHATLATAAVLTRELAWTRDTLRFASQSGVLGVRRHDDGARLILDFPARPPAPVTDASLIARLGAALGRPPREVLLARDLVAIYDTPDDVRALAPDMAQLCALEVHGVIATARAGAGATADADVDFVSRFFVPAQGIPEDPVTGSAHCTLTPLWAARLDKLQLRARQVSRRGGELDCVLRGDRVDLAGDAVIVARGTLHLP